MTSARESLQRLAVVLMLILVTRPALGAPAVTHPHPGSYPTTPPPVKTTKPPPETGRTLPIELEKLAPEGTIRPDPTLPVIHEHEFSTIPGVVEDVTDVILNLKSATAGMVKSTPKFDNQQSQLLDQVEKAQDAEELWTVLTPVFTLEDWWRLYQRLQRLLDPEFWTRLRKPRFYGGSHPAPPAPKPQDNEFGSDYRPGCTTEWNNQKDLAARASLMGDGTCDYAKGTILFYDWLDWWGETLLPGTSMQNVGQYSAEVETCKARAAAALMEKVKTHIAGEQAKCPKDCRFSSSSSGLETVDSCTMVISTKPVEHYNHNTNVNAFITLFTSCSR